MKLALVTGASSGIGAAAVRQLVARGARVVAVARSRDGLEQVTRELGGAAVAMPCDAADGDAVLRLADAVIDEQGVPDVIVNSAGAGAWRRIEETSPAEAVAMMSAPYFAAFNVTRAFVPAMLARRSGVLIHVNSPAAIFPWPAAVGYAAARWALRGLHESLCQDLAGTGVRSCHVVLGRVDSPYFDRNEGATENMPAVARLVRTLGADECGRLIARLAERPSREVIHPAMLRLFALTHRVAPGLVALAGRAGARRRDAR